MCNDYLLQEGSLVNCDELYAIYMDELINPYLNIELMDKVSFEKLFKELISSGQLYIYLYKQKIIASCIVKRQERRANHVASLGTLVTRPHLHRNGVGTSIIKDLMVSLKKDGIKRIDLYCATDNPIALKFYEKLGFQLEGTLKKYFKRENEQHYTDVHVMAIGLDLLNF